MQTVEQEKPEEKDESYRSVDRYSWWLYEGRKNPVCIVDKEYNGVGHTFRCTHVKTLRIGESNPTSVAIDDFWKLVDSGTITNVTKGTQVTVLEPVAE